MNPYFFEIVRRDDDRYSWVLVGYRDGRRRVLARAHRDYRSARKARRAVEALKDVIGDADIIIACPPSHHLPVAGFDIVSGVLPLRTGPFDPGGRDAGATGRKAVQPRGTRTAAAEQS